MIGEVPLILTHHRAGDAGLMSGLHGTGPSPRMICHFTSTHFSIAVTSRLSESRLDQFVEPCLLACTLVHCGLTPIAMNMYVSTIYYCWLSAPSQVMGTHTEPTVAALRSRPQATSILDTLKAACAHAAFTGTDHLLNYLLIQRLNYNCTGDSYPQSTCSFRPGRNRPLSSTSCSAFPRHCPSMRGGVN